MHLRIHAPREVACTSQRSKCRALPFLKLRIATLSLLLESRQIDALCYVVLNPVAIPPFLGIDLHAIQLHREVNVIAASHSCHAALSHHLAALDHVALMHIDVAKMAVDCLQPVTMVDDYAVAVDPQRRGIHDSAII